MMGILSEPQARYLVDEVKDKSNRAIDITSWKQEPVGGLPLQKNGYVFSRVPWISSSYVAHLGL